VYSSARLSEFLEPGNITLTGEVRFPGKYPIHRGETLSSVVRRAGGFTDLAFVEGTVYLREELKQRERDQLDLLANRLQSDLTSLSLEVVSSSTLANNGNGAAGGAQALAIAQQLMTQLRQLKPVGRLVSDINRVMKGRPGVSEDVLVRDGDSC
jgi:polysaccharide biosynthesis/export protein